MFVKDTSSNELIECEIEQIDELQLKEILKRSNFKFNWRLEIQFDIHALKIKNTEVTLGLVSLHSIPEEMRIEIRLLESTKENIGRNKKYGRIAGCLIAFACREAFKRGYFGFVSLIPKTKLINHYIIEYGFKQVGRHLAIDQENSKHLIDKYLDDRR